MVHMIEIHNVSGYNANQLYGDNHVSLSRYSGRGLTSAIDVVLVNIHATICQISFLAMNTELYRVTPLQSDQTCPILEATLKVWSKVRHFLTGSCDM